MFFYPKDKKNQTKGFFPSNGIVLYVVASEVNAKTNRDREKYKKRKHYMHICKQCLTQKN